MTIFFEQLLCYPQYSSRHHKRIRPLRAPSLLESSGFVPLLLLPAPRQAGRDCSALCIVLVLVAVRFCLWTMMAELCFSVDDFIRTICLISAIQQQTPQYTTAAGTVAAGQQRLRAPTTPASPAPSRSGLFCLLRVVLVLVGVRFVCLWTMMAELCFCLLYTSPSPRD